MTDEHDVRVPLPDYVRQIAEAAAVKAAKTVIDDHVKTCPFAVEKHGERLRTLEVKFATAIGYMVGSGCVGGSLAVGMLKLLGV